MEQITYHKINKETTKKITKELFEDKEVFQNLTIHGLVDYEEFPKKFQNNKDMIEYLIRGRNEKHKIPKHILMDKEFLMHLLSLKMTFENVPLEYREDLTICNAALKLQKNFQLIDESIKNNKENLLFFAKDHAVIYFQMDSKFKNDFEFIMKLLDVNMYVYLYLSDRYQSDKYIILKLLQKYPNSLDKLHIVYHLKNLWNDVEFVLEMID